MWKNPQADASWLRIVAPTRWMVARRDSSQDEVREGMRGRGIQTSVHYPPIHRFTQYRRLGARRPLPVTDNIAGRLVTLPLYPHMSEEQIIAVTESVAQATRGLTALE